MYWKFQMVGSSNENTIAVVKNEVDADSFRKDQGWYEVFDAPVKNIKEAASEPEDDMSKETIINTQEAEAKEPVKAARGRPAKSKEAK